MIESKDIKPDMTFKIKFKVLRQAKDGDVFNGQPVRNLFGTMWWVQDMHGSLPEFLCCFDGSEVDGLEHPTAQG